ncbi:MAG: ATP-binding protein [Limnochordia bacterium]
MVGGIHELAANAIEHGNGFDPQKKFSIQINRNGQQLTATVTDQGEGFNWRNVPAQVSLDPEERGRGIPLIRLLNGRLVFNERGNVDCR